MATLQKKPPRIHAAALQPKKFVLYGVGQVLLCNKSLT